MTENNELLTFGVLLCLQTKITIGYCNPISYYRAERFTCYLSDNYRTGDEGPNDNRELVKHSLPIVMIYFLEFPFDDINAGFVKINRDVITQKMMYIKSDVIELLTYDSYLVQARKPPKGAHKTGAQHTSLQSGASNR